MSKCHIAGCNYPESECTGGCATTTRKVRGGGPPPTELPDEPVTEPIWDEIGRMLAWGSIAVGAVVCGGIIVGVIAARV